MKVNFYVKIVVAYTKIIALLTDFSKTNGLNILANNSVLRIFLTTSRIIC